MASPMKIRAQLKGDVTDIKILMAHPMETGQRKDAKTNQPIPAHFIQEFTVEVGGKTYFGCCPMCKERLATDAEARQAMDPVSGRMVDKAVAGMDDALLKAVDANRAALQTFVSQGADLREKHLKKAIADLEKMEDTMFAALKKAAEGANAPLAGAWQQVMDKMQAGGTLSGAKAATTAEEMVAQMQTAMRDTRAASLRAAQSLAESYAAMVSGVLIGMSEALQQGSAKPAAKSAKGR